MSRQNARHPLTLRSRVGILEGQIARLNDIAQIGIAPKPRLHKDVVERLRKDPICGAMFRMGVGGVL